MQGFKCIVVDDSYLDRLALLMLLKEAGIFDIRGVFTSAEEALPFLEKEEVEVLFLDIDMPGISGLELRKKLPDIPVCIFISSHPDYALESFELDTLDYLTKPIDEERFGKMLSRLTDYLDMRYRAGQIENKTGDVIRIRGNRGLVKLKIDDIIYLEALKNHTVLVTEKDRHYIHTGLGTLLEEDRFRSFIRIHRSYAVQKRFVNKIDTSEIQLQTKISLPVGKSYRQKIDLLL